MNFNDYEAIWQRQKLPAESGAEMTSLKDSFETKRRKMAVTLLTRDLVEGTAGLFVSWIYARTWWRIGANGWPIAFAIALLIGVTAIFVKERIRAHRHRLGPGKPILEKLNADITELQHQRTLLRTVWKWYLTPIAAAIVIFVLTLLRVAIIKLSPDRLAHLIHHPLIWSMLAITFGLCAGCIWFIGRINQRAIRKQIDPRLTELETLRADLLASK